MRRLVLGDGIGLRLHNGGVARHARCMVDVETKREVIRWAVEALESSLCNCNKSRRRLTPYPV